MDREVPILALTLGDPVGIGPEIVARTLADPPPDVEAVGLAVGDARTLRRAIEVCDLEVDVHPVASVEEARCEAGSIDILDLGVLDSDLAWGEVSAQAGRAALAAIERAADEALQRHLDAVVTAPINKEAVWKAGSEHLGHTELLGELTGSDRSDTMLEVGNLKIMFTTRHLALCDAVDQVTRSRVRHVIGEAWKALQVLGYEQPLMAVAALNPHGGEGGSFGREDLDEIGPACQDARDDGIPVEGPVGADAVFHYCLQGRYDAVVSHFHDQGHIAAKTADFYNTASITFGLPIIRTSVDHGTAFDIAGTGQADHRSMLAAYRAAARYAPCAERARKEYGSA
ncbi:MAG: 4-hydroxythreonine-4-phosphate dehydrogenase PdxA [Actinomycetota bacterium]|nr:4-hydroxythreonine-4-phosphate dehydrogenase PdxA [Actinomycetota bacterium]